VIIEVGKKKEKETMEAKIEEGSEKPEVVDAVVPTAIEPGITI
jgi:hypothetical protein